MDIIVFGSAIVDFICYVPRLPKAGETLHGNKFSTGFGGKGANQCVAAARLGANTGLIAKLGKDTWGDKYLRQLQNEKVNISYVKQCPNETTGIAQINVASNGENQIVIVAGANNLLTADDVIEAENLFKTAKILICQLETPIDGTLSALKNFNGISILNGAPALENMPVNLLQAATIFCVNETEASLLIENQDVKTIEQAKYALEKIIEMGAREVIITLGGLGAVYGGINTMGKFFHVPAKKIEKVVDTTGAGDAFIGSLAYFLLRFPQKPLHQHIGAACRVASHSVQYPGTQASFPTLSELNIDLNVESFDYNSI